MRVLDLFAGIGGFSLAAHWMGWETAAFVEWEDFPQRVLKKNFPDVPIYGDIKDFHYEQEKERIGPINLICGGFPCQPFSHAGKQGGTADDRYLWPEMLRVIRETRPSFVVGENVAGLLSMDGGAVFEQVCTSLEDEGYAVQPFIIPAIAVGAPHRRDRIWIVANRTSEGLSKSGQARKWELSSQGGAGLHNRLKQPDWSRRWHEVATELCRMDDGISSELDELTNSNRTKRLKALGNAIVPQVAYEIFRAIQNEMQ